MRRNHFLRAWPQRVLPLILLLMLCTPMLGQQRLLAIGGGERPVEAMKRFAAWSGGEKGRVLVITWASSVPDESFASLRIELIAAGAGQVEHAPPAPLDESGRETFLQLLGSTTGVFFSGGDQNRIMDVLADEELLALLRKRYTAGTPFGGTSAGAAVMSDPMMTGDADLKLLDGAQVGVRKGLGLVPNVIFDQHFLVRQRHNRLFGLVMVNPKMLGIGIDEDTAVLIEDNKKMVVLGKTRVMTVNPRKEGDMLVTFLSANEQFDLKRRKRIGR